jgi:hypothetical protein
MTTIDCANILKITVTKESGFWFILPLKILKYWISTTYPRGILINFGIQKEC